DTEPFETDESVATRLPPPAYRTIVRMSIRAQEPILFPSEAEVARLLAIPTPPPSPLTLLSSPLPQIPSPPTHTSPTYAKAPLVDHREEVPKADLPPQKRLCLIAPIPRFEVGESSIAVAA
ncbi:hypothetical protein Tco_1050976, partial [Tanacetum coccineum]